MSIQVVDYVSVATRLEELGGRNSIQFALLPTNFDSVTKFQDLRQVPEAATVRALFRKNNITHDELFESDRRAPYIHNNSSDLVLPALFVSAAMFSENPNQVSVALGVLSNYVTDFFKGLSGEKKVKLEVVIEKSGSRACKKIVYVGPAEGLKELPKTIRSLADE